MVISCLSVESNGRRRCKLAAWWRRNSVSNIPKMNGWNTITSTIEYTHACCECECWYIFLLILRRYFNVHPSKTQRSRVVTKRSSNVQNASIDGRVEYASCMLFRVIETKVWSETVSTMILVYSFEGCFGRIFEEHRNSLSLITIIVIVMGFCSVAEFICEIV